MSEQTAPKEEEGEPLGVESMTEILRGGPPPIRRLLDLYGPVELHIVLKRDTEDPSSGWTGEVHWRGDEWATVHASTRDLALDLIAGYVRAA